LGHRFFFASSFFPLGYSGFSGGFTFSKARRASCGFRGSLIGPDCLSVGTLSDRLSHVLCPLDYFQDIGLGEPDALGLSPLSLRPLIFRFATHDNVLPEVIYNPPL
jgi:hypothetical protein